MENKTNIPNNYKTVTCPKCHQPMTPIMVEESEFNKKTGKLTGRKRNVCSQLTCKACGHEIAVDSDYLAGPWE